MNDFSRSRRTIVHLSKHCGRGNGNVHVAVDLACEQARAGHHVYFCSGGGTFVRLLEREGVHHLTLPQDQRKPFALLRSMAVLTRLCRAISADIIHAHMMGGVLVGAVASRFAGVPLVTTVHNSFDRHSVLMRLGDRIVAVSEADRKSLIDRGFPQDRTRVVWNAPVASARNVDVADRAPGSVPRLRRPNITLICGLHARKGVFDVIEAAASLLSSMPEWTLYIAGEGPDRAELEERVGALGLAERIIFLGYVEGPEVLYSQTDIFVLASYADPGSLTIGEARAAGCAIVATSVGGTPEMLGFGTAGRLVPPGRPDIMGRELGEIMRDLPRRAAMGRAARRGAEIFEARRLVPDYMRVYEEIVRRQQPAKRHSAASRVSEHGISSGPTGKMGRQENACPR
ncbi:glycosyl transferase [Gluconacetobacter liquefaciens]|uniref:Glycosyltransferase family 4 protein n=1 Tax=Gluconacetobacter liquefaciens TaxID=89584 RepID=A0A370G054_GLULI|nr:glycosyltransferase family 4 protein [Gluconacetobacter liquefaciens]MBB2187150.1 glycosyltransferase family 4 protein [Gluconacetobacter liquefaciens]RDI37128.1 glycosyltransferase involved in cell wall biosynthesis [Gluconacetobacter liquefaciens]GEB37875.1 glycosyl transferase [Gluconacetobacter liquefaciens]